MGGSPSRACQYACQKGDKGRQETMMGPPEHVTPGEIRYYKRHACSKRGPPMKYRSMTQLRDQYP